MKDLRYEVKHDIQDCREINDFLKTNRSITQLSLFGFDANDLRKNHLKLILKKTNVSELHILIDPQAEKGTIDAIHARVEENPKKVRKLKLEHGAQEKEFEISPRRITFTFWPGCSISF